MSGQPDVGALSWPSLYTPAFDFLPSGDPVQRGGRYLADPKDIFRFTLYWTLIFHIPFYALCGTYAFLNFAFPPSWSPRAVSSALLHEHRTAHTSPTGAQWTKPRPRTNVHRSRLTFALLVILAFLLLSLAGAVVGSAVVGFALAGVYKAGGFQMSTWIPFVWAVIQSLVGLLGMWPSVIDII